MARQTNSDTPVALESEARDDTQELKTEIAKRIHDQRTQLHILEWQADVQGRRTRPPTPQS